MNINYKHNIQIKKLKDLTTKAPKSKYSANSITLMEQGNIKCFTSGSKFYFVNKELVNGEYLFINDGGIADIKYHNGSACYTDHVFALKINSNLCNGIYLYNYLLTKLETINNTMFVGCGLKNIVKEDFLNLDIPLPEKRTQDFIANIFLNIDEKLEKEGNNITKLKETKLSFLELLFPQNIDIPQLRFRNFTNDWEQRKLEDYLDVSNKKNIKGLYSKQNVLSVSGEYGIVNQIEFLGRSFAGKSVLNYSIVNKGDIVYTKSPLNTNPYGIVKTNKNDIGIVSTLYAIYTPKENTNPNFVQDYFDLHYRLNAYLHPLVHKGAKNDMKISSQNALKGIVTFPSYEEQTAISNLFEKLNNLITLHQRKLDKLKEVKSALLDKLLI